MNAKQIANIKRALTGAAGKRLDQMAEAQRGLPQSLQSAATQRAAAKVLAKALKASEAAKEFAAVLAKDEAELSAALNKTKVAAVARSSDRLAQLQAQAANRIRNLEQLAVVPAQPASVRRHLLKKPMFILPSRTIALDENEVIPGKSFAKFRGRVERKASFWGNVKFFYLWNNPDNKFSVINVDGYIIFNGHANVGANGGTFPGDRSASVTIRGHLDILEWDQQPPTQPPSQPDQTVEALRLQVREPGFFEAGALKEKFVFRGYDLRHTLLVVPPLATLVFTVNAEVTAGCGADSGLVEFDFSSGGFQVGSPAVLVTLLS